MSMLIRLLFAFTGYLCVATVLSLLLGLGYLWQNGTLTNEKVFQVFALLQNVETDVEPVREKTEEERIPPEEFSNTENMQRRILNDRSYELKSEQLTRQLGEFRHMWGLLADEMDRRDLLAKTLDSRIAKASQEIIDKGMAEVAGHWNLQKPQQVKSEIQKLFDAGEKEKLVSLLGQVDDSQLKKVLQQFKSDGDLTTLYEIHKLISEGFPVMGAIQQTKQELQNLQADSK